MANTNYEVKFTDETYATKEDVSEFLGTNLIEDTWDKVIGYRKPHQILLPLRNLGKAPFRVTLNSALLSKINKCDSTLTNVKKAFDNFKGSDASKKQLVKLQHKNIAKIMAKKYGVILSEEVFDDIYNRELTKLSPEEQKLSHYIAALRELEKHFADPINEDLLTRLYSILSNSIDSFILYRETELIKTNSIYIKEYSSVPISMIEPMMENLFDFINNSAQSIFMKFAACYYSIKIIKPFDKYYDELALLLSKMILAHGDKYGQLQEVAMYLPLEEIVVEYENRFKSILSFIQKENDITYIFSDLLPYFNDAGKYCLDSLSSFDNHLAVEEKRRDEEIFVAPKEEPKVEVKEKPVEQISIFDSPKEEIKVEPVKKVEPKVEQKQVQVAFVKPNVVAPQMSEREAAKYERYLLESDPRLKKGQAHFFARHCTVGMFYTIKQYKRMIGCVYETARTSMDDLAKYGYYEKTNVKNKFVYTPVKKVEE